MTQKCLAKTNNDESRAHKFQSLYRNVTENISNVLHAMKSVYIIHLYKTKCSK